MKNYLLKNLTTAFVIIFTVGVGGAWAQLPGQPANSYVSGSNWYCKEGYQKSGNECVSIFVGMPNGMQPSNSYVSGANWYCKEGYQKSGNECVSIFVGMPNGMQPSNSYVSGANWYCKEGYQKSGNQCVSIFVGMPNGMQPSNSYVSGANWYCKEGYQKNDNECISIFAGMDNKIDSRLKNSANIEKELLQKERQQLINERRNLEEERRVREQARKSQRINLQVTNTQPDSNGFFNMTIKANADTASLKINDEEQGGKQDGNYSVKKVARAGQETKFTIVAVDINGNTDIKTIAVTRQVAASIAIKYAELNPSLVKIQPNKDAVAIIIGITDYKNLPRADYANDDARAFYDYAIRGLGVRAENIKLLVDGDAGQGEIYKVFKIWLPSRVKATTDVYVYYSGHGLPAADGQSLYLLPQLADRDLIEETAIAQSKINTAIQAAKPKSVTIFLDSCYSGAGRTGATLLASARPIAIKSTAQAFPAEFTVISASTAEQISSSSPDLKHGIFSYYLMRGMEGDADTNKDGKITAGEMHSYLMDNVTRQASLVNRVQSPQLAGDANRVLIGR